MSELSRERHGVFPPQRHTVAPVTRGLSAMKSSIGTLDSFCDLELFSPEAQRIKRDLCRSYFSKIQSATQNRSRYDPECAKKKREGEKSQDGRHLRLMEEKRNRPGKSDDQKRYNNAGPAIQPEGS